MKMIREIEEAVIEYKENTAVELYNLLQNDAEFIEWTGFGPIYTRKGSDISKVSRS